MEKARSFQDDYNVLLAFISCFLSNTPSPAAPAPGLSGLVLDFFSEWCQRPSGHRLLAVSFQLQSCPFIHHLPPLPLDLIKQGQMLPRPHAAVLDKAAARGEVPPPSLTPLRACALTV